MNFVLRIFFSGLISFVPSQDGKELTVLLINAASGHIRHISDGSALPEHMPMLLARAANCAGDCPSNDSSVAAFLFPDMSASAGGETLARAVNQGAVWRLSGADLSLGVPADGVQIVRRGGGLRRGAIPTSPSDRASFDWVPNLKEIQPSAGGINQAMLSPNPPGDLIVARLRLRGGKVSTYSMIQIGGQVKPIDYLPLDSRGTASYERAAANWVMAEIRVPGDALEVVESSFDGRVTRSMKLTPIAGKVEMALLNMSQPPVTRMSDGAPQPGKHFELYWDLEQNPPASQSRPVPQAPRSKTAMRTWSSLHPATADRDSALLNDLLFPGGGGRGPYDQLLCPMSQSPNP